MKRSLGFLLLGLAACSPAGGGPGHPEKPDLAVPADLGVVPADKRELSIVAGQPGGPGHLNAPGSAARLETPTGLAADGAGRLYVSDQTDTVRVLDLATGALTLLAGRPYAYADTDGIGTEARFASISGLTLDRGTGALLATEGGGYATIRRITPATGAVENLAGAWTGERGATDGTGSAALFDGPDGAVADTAGNLYVTDGRNQTIRKVVLATGAVSTLAGTPGMRGSTDGVGAAARFSDPRQPALDGAGNLYVTESGNHLIRKIEIATAKVSTLAGTPGTTGDSADGTGSAARLNKPSGLVFDAGRLIVAEAGNHTLRTVTLPAGTVTALAGLAKSPGSADGIGSAARLGSPGDLAADGAGNVYVADAGNHTLRKLVPATGAVTTLAGTPPQPGSADGTGSAARFDAPAGVVADGAGNAYVADGLSATIRKVVLATGAVTTLAGSPGLRGSTDGIGSAARFNDPAALALDGAGGLYVTEPYGQVVRRIDLATAAVTTLAGLAGTRGSADGTGSAARFDSPQGIAADGAGSVYVADRSNDTIRKIAVATGAVTTIAGQPGIGRCRNGIGTAAFFSDPYGLAYDGAGNLYIAEPLSSLVRKLALASGQVSTVAGLGNGSVVVDAGTTSPDIGIGDVYMPESVAVDAAGTVYVASRYVISAKIALVLSIDPKARRITTLIGTPPQKGLRTGPLPAGINRPGGLALTPAGELLLTDQTENVLLRLR